MLQGYLTSSDFIMFSQQRSNSSPQFSPYVDMLLQLDRIPWWHDLLSNLFTWLLLAGYIVFPGAFTSIRNSKTLSEDAGAAGKAVVAAARTWPILLVASICCGVGVMGMCWLWWTWQDNYIWLLNKIIVYF